MSTKREVSVHLQHLNRMEKAFNRPFSLSSHLMVASYVGSTSHGTYVSKGDPHAIDDIDIMGVIVPPLPYKLSLNVFEHWVWQSEELDVVTYALEKWVRLILKGNPNVVGMLWLPPHLSLHQTPPWAWWVHDRKEFLSKQMHAPFVGYAYAQLHKLGAPGERAYMGKERKQLVEKYGYDLKNAAHCVRLLNMGNELLRTGELFVDRTGRDAELLKDIKRGKLLLKEVQELADAGFKNLDAAVEKSPLPDHPNEQLANELLFATYFWFWKERDHGYSSLANPKRHYSVTGN